MSALSAFNKILVDFAKNLETTFPEDTDFMVFRRGIEDLLKFNAVAPLGMFRSYVTPVEQVNGNGEVVQINIKEKILDNDSSFFINEMDYSGKLDEHGTKNDNAFNTIDKLKIYWNKLTPQGQAVVMKYLSSLVKISDQIPG